MHHSRSIPLVLFLLSVGIILIILHIVLKSDEAVPAGDSVWQITLSATVKQGKDKSDLHMAIPQDSANIHIASVTFEHPNFNLKRVTQKKRNQREIIATPTKAGEITFSAEYKVHVSNAKRWQDAFNKPVNLSPESLLQYLSTPSGLSMEDVEISGILKDLHDVSDNSESLTRNIFTYVNQEIISDSSSVFESSEKILESRRANAVGKARLMVLLSRISNIPARIVTGVIVKEMLDMHEHYWVEVYLNKRWVSFDPTIGLEKDLPPNYLKLTVDSDLIAFLDDGTPVEVTIDSIQVPTPAGLLGTGDRKVFDILDLSRLSLSTQFMLATLLLLPIGALITSFFRQMIGILTYGTFTPSLLAMATIHAEWLTVIVVVLIVIAVGFGSRTALPEKMARVPRLSIILTIVAIGMVFSISIMDYYQLNPNPAVILLPIIVLTGMVDRFYATTDESGILAALYRLVWTFIVTAFCFIVFIIEPIQQLVLSYPEIHFFTIALILLISIYKGKKLCSLPYCQWLRGPLPRSDLKKNAKEISTD